MKQAFVDGLDEEGTIVPQAPQGFSFPFGNIGPWHKVDAYEVSGYNAAQVAEAMELKPGISTLVGRTQSENGTWDKLYYAVKQQPEALQVQRAVRNNPQAFVTSVTQFACKSDSVLPEALEFDLVYTVNKRSFGVNGSNDYQLITLPSMVYAYAVSNGWEVPEFGFREISDPRNFTAMEGKALEEYEAKLLAQRTALWGALGETNAKADTFMGAKNWKGEPMSGPNVAVSEKLSEALKFATTNWRGNFYAKIGRTVKPSDAQGRVPVVIGVYENKDVALAALTKVDTVTDSEFTGLFFPASFKESGMTVEEYAGVLVDDTKLVLETYRAAPTGPKKVQAKAALNQKLAEFELTEEQYMAWATKLGL